MDNYLLITGASSGVGKALVTVLSKDYNLVLNGRDKQALEETAKNCRNKVLIWQQDLAELETLEAALTNFIESKEIAIDKFVHCAGEMKMIPCKMLNSASFLQTFSVNIFSAALITKILISRKINSNALESVVFISSNISNRGTKAFSVYGSSKAALDGLMRNLAIELAPRVRVNSILPGGMKTKMTEGIFADEEAERRIQQKYPLGIGKPEDLAGIAEFLLSDKAKWITGQQFTVDGGRTIDMTD